MTRRSLSACKVWGEIELRAPAVGVKIGVFLYVTLVLPVRGGHSSNNYASIWTVFSTSVTGPDVLCHLEFSKFGILVMYPVLERDSALSYKISR